MKQALVAIIFIIFVHVIGISLSNTDQNEEILWRDEYKVQSKN